MPDHREQPTTGAVGFGGDQFRDLRQRPQSLAAHEDFHGGGGGIT
jgi:hypothetical protein